MNDASPNTIDGLMTLAPVIPVLTIERLEDAAPLAQALVAGGLKVLEVTLRTPAGLEAIGRMIRAAPGAIIGAGTVLTAADYARAVTAGARFVVSPGLTEPLVTAARRRALPFLPGVATASEIMRGLDAGLSRFKFFPAESSGGAAAVRALAGPFASCRFCPTGGINAESAKAYLSLPNVFCVGGAWVAPPDLVKAGDFDRIVALAKAAAALRDE